MQFYLLALTSIIQHTLKDSDGVEYSFYIPIYQRKFAWGEQQIKDFLEEITELFDKGFIAKEENDLPKKIEYSEDIFFGTIYLTNTRINGEFQFKEVIDGQQRITTWYLFLLASFSLLDEYKEIYIKENNVSRFKKQFKEFYFYIRKLLFYNSDKPNFEVKYEHLKYVTHQKDDKDVWELLFKELIPKKMIILLIWKIKT